MTVKNVDNVDIKINKVLVLISSLYLASERGNNKL